MSPAQLRARILALGPQTQVEVKDLTGTQNHYEVRVVSPAFEGKNRIQQHRLVFDLVKAEMDSGEVHALALTTLGPGEKA